MQQSNFSQADKLKVLLTGATGYLGQFALRELLSQSVNVVLLLRRQLELPGAYQIPEIILFDGTSFDRQLEEQLLRASPDVIIHAAAMASATACEEEPELAYSANVDYTKLLVKLSELLQIPMVYCSTDLVFDGISHVPNEGIGVSVPPCPNSVYARTKAAAEKEVLASERGIIARLSLLYGGRAPFDGKLGPLGWMREALEAGGEINLFADEWRSPIFVEDAARFLALLALKSPEGRIYHISGSESVSRVELGEIFANLSGGDLSLIKKRLRSEVSSNPERPENVTLSNEAICREFGVQPVPIVEAFRLIAQENAHF